MAVTDLVGLRPKVNEIGRIRMGDKDNRGLPISLSTFRLTSYDKAVLEAAQALYGGEVKAWTDAPDPGMWELITAASALDVLFPRSLQSISQRYELWSGGTCQRRCDGRIEELTESACICGPQRGEDGYCDVVTRMSVILPRLPGLGIWRLDTGGWHAATTIPSTLELLMALDPRAMVPAVLRAVQRSSKTKTPDGKTVTRRFIVPVLDAPGITIGQLVGGSASEAALLDSGDEPVARPAPPTAAERVARTRAEAEARQTPAVVVEEPPLPPEPPQRPPATPAVNVTDDLRAGMDLIR